MRKFLASSVTLRSHATLKSIAQIVVFASIASFASAQQFNTLYSFTGNSDGAYPVGTVIRDSQGNLYGTAWYGGNANGTDGHGTVYEYTASGEIKVLYAFTGDSDGSNPFSGLVMDSQGNLYGTTPSGGTFGECSTGCGVVYEVTPEGKELVLHSFYGPDGIVPMSGLYRDAQGNLYGTTTSEGGLYGGGTVFELTNFFGFATLYAFEGGSDGAAPYAGVTMDNMSNIYGTTSFGGGIGLSTTRRNNGTAFEITRTGAKETLHSFSGGLDGAIPDGVLAWNPVGGLFGTTSTDGKYGCGTVFQIIPDGKEKILHEFSGTPDGCTLWAGVSLDAKGNIFGTTVGGGEYGFGAVFVITPSGQEKILHSFTGSDGSSPFGGLVVDGKGNIYGTASSGGAYGFGTIFEITQ